VSKSTTLYSQPVVLVCPEPRKFNVVGGYEATGRVASVNAGKITQAAWRKVRWVINELQASAAGSRQQGEGVIPPLSLGAARCVLAGIHGRVKATALWAFPTN
ncbi:hypothetical protein KI387_041609, partial [Taxus chinensis]